MWIRISTYPRCGRPLGSRTRFRRQQKLATVRTCITVPHDKCGPEKKSNGHLQSHILCTRVCLSSRKCTLVRRKGCVLPKNTAITWPRRANTSASSAPTSVAARPSRAMSWPSISPSSTSSGLYSLEKEGVYSTQNKHR